MIRVETKNCPGCNKSEAVKEVSPEIDPLQNTPLLEKYWRGFYKDKIFFPYFRCNCGLLYNKDFFDNDSLEKLYSSMDDNIHGDVDSDNMTRDSYVKFIESLNLKTNISILEIGADNGSFSKKLVEKFNPSKMDVVEPNRAMEPILKEISTNNYKDINEINIDYKYDLIVAIHVLDHLTNLTDFMNRIKSLLKPKGYFIIIVHNESSILAKILGKRWPAYCLQHPHLFNKKTLTSTMDIFEFNEVKIEDSINFFKFGYLIKHFFLAFFKIDIKVPNMFTIGLKLGNIISIYQKDSKGL